MNKNIFGEPLITCSTNPITGFFRNGCCDSSENDFGKHLVCAVMNDRFLEFQLVQGNDLISPKKDFQNPSWKNKRKYTNEILKKLCGSC